MSQERNLKTLEQWRILRGYSQRELAEKAGVDNGLISLIESGKRITFRPKTMKLLAEALEVTQFDIVEFAPLMQGKDLPARSLNQSGRSKTRVYALTYTLAL